MYAPVGYHTIDSIGVERTAIMPLMLDRLALAALAAVPLVVWGPAAPARAQGKLDALYTASLAGIPLGKGAWVVEIGEDQYTATASGVTTGLMRVFASGGGSGIARGQISSGMLVPAAYAASITAERKTEELRMGLAGGVVKELSVEPPTPPHPERIPITDIHRRGVTDPMTASLVRVAGLGNPISPDACNRTTAIFDGRLRYDLTLAFKRIDTVKAEKGYAGPAAVCAVYFRPIAGYVPNRPAVKYLTEQRDMEVWLAPITGTRILVPFRIAVPTPLGTGMLQATQFIAAPQVPRATPTSMKSQ